MLNNIEAELDHADKVSSTQSFLCEYQQVNDSEYFNIEDYNESYLSPVRFKYRRSIYQDDPQKYLQYNVRLSTPVFSEDGYENYEDVPDWNTYREAYPDQELPEIDPDDLRAYWAAKEEQSQP
jgi:hypothetical protein